METQGISGAATPPPWALEVTDDGLKGPRSIEVELTDGSRLVLDSLVGGTRSAWLVHAFDAVTDKGGALLFAEYVDGLEEAVAFAEDNGFHFNQGSVYLALEDGRVLAVGVKPVILGTLPSKIYPKRVATGEKGPELNVRHLPVDLDSHVIAYLRVDPEHQILGIGSEDFGGIVESYYVEDSGHYPSGSIDLFDTSAVNEFEYEMKCFLSRVEDLRAGRQWPRYVSR